MPTVTPAHIGARLRRARVASGLSIPEAAWRMRTRPEVLRSLEREDFGDLGHPADARTHLMSYARLLGIDHDEITAAFDAITGGARPAIDELDARVRRSRRPPRARWILAASISALIIATAAVAGLVGGQAERQAPEVALPPVAVSPTGAVPAAEARVRAELRTSRGVQISVQADGVEIFDGVLPPGDTRMFRARSALEILAADGGVVSVSLGGRDLGTLGRRGQVARVRLGPNGRLDA